MILFPFCTHTLTTSTSHSTLSPLPPQDSQLKQLCHPQQWYCSSLVYLCNYAHASFATPTWQIRRAAESANLKIGTPERSYRSPWVTMDHIVREQLDSLLQKHVPEASIGWAGSYRLCGMAFALQSLASNPGSHWVSLGSRLCKADL